jgi:acyl carrier protein
MKNNGTENAILDAVITLIRTIASRKDVSASTNILIELDIDSLQLLDLVEQIRVRFGIDILKEPDSIQMLSSPASIAEAINRIRKSQA